MNEEKSPKDIIFDFADMIAESCGTKEEPNLPKALLVLATLTELGKSNPVFVRKLFSESFTNELVACMAKTKNMNMLDMISVATNLKKAFDNA